MKTIIGLDLGTTSVGWALVKEAETDDENSSIVRTGVRVNPVSTEDRNNFEKGKSVSYNADRTLKRSGRRNLQRYKLRRSQLIKTLKDNGFISNESILCEDGKDTTFETLKLRAKSVKEEIGKTELARVLLMINKKRGYKSSRKSKTSDEGQSIDSIDISKTLKEKRITPGKYVLSLLEQGKTYIPEFYPSDLREEFDKVWEKQQSFYPDVLTDELKDKLQNKNKAATWAICSEPFNIKGIKRTAKGIELKKENYKWRVLSLQEKVDLEVLAIVLQEINGQMNSSGSYLSDRSKILYFENLTIGEYLWQQLEKDSHSSLKNQVFYRQDYLDEFEKIWDTQAKYHKELTPQLKKEIRDIIIFYQRPLKSQKSLISFCEFESRQKRVKTDGKKKTITIGLRVCPKSSPLFQEFRIWQILNNLKITDKSTEEDYLLGQEDKDLLFKELSIKEKLSKSDVLKLLCTKHRSFDLNFDKIEGNKTQAKLFEAYAKIIDASGHGEYDFSKMNYSDVMNIIEPIFEGLGYNTDILHFDSSLEGKDFERQPAYKLWHLLYSVEGDNSKTGNEKLTKKITELTKFPEEYSKLLASITFEPDYCSLSTKAMRKILPFMKEGNEYSVACGYAGYRHSKRSLTKSEIENKILKDRLELIPHNSLRNPIVEKILNQMIHVVNGIIDEYGKPDEIRIEMARELKKSQKERDEMSAGIAKNNKANEEVRKILQTEYGIANVSRNDIIRYKLYLELKENGFRTLYSNTYIPPEKVFSKEFDIEHIIPQARLFDDSFSNKTLEKREVNIEKSNMTAYDYVDKSGSKEAVQDYVSRVKNLLSKNQISIAKYKKLLMKESDIPEDFINRDLRDTQYIAKKASEILGSVVKTVVSTTGQITDRLREDWGLVDVMKELNWDKYDKLGLTERFKDRDGREIRRIKDWTKRNDHRHHAMDAIAIAFTKPSFIQYLNNLNAKSNKQSNIYAIEQKELYKDKHGKLRFKPPIDSPILRAEARKHLENTLVSIKAKNKVVTQNVNITKKRNGKTSKIQLTPRGQLHDETIYGSIKQYNTKDVKVDKNLTPEVVETIANKKYREALLKRLEQFDNDPIKAFTGKNSPKKNPIWLNDKQTQQVPDKVKTVTPGTVYTIRKNIDKDLKIEKVVDAGIKKILQKRLEQYDNDPAKAFSDLGNNPIWLNEEKGIAVKRVTITGRSNPIPIRYKRDKNGDFILENGEKIPNDFVNLGNNHHIAIYRDKDGALKDKTVSFFEALERANKKLPVIDKEYNKDLGWKLLFTLKQNEYFVFPNPATGFFPEKIDLMNPDNYALISPNLFRVQKISDGDYVFRHHLETTVEEKKELQNIAWKRIKSLPNLEGIVKVRINHIGKIAAVGEY